LLVGASVQSEGCQWGNSCHSFVPHCDAIYGFHTNNIWDFDQLYALKFWNGDSFIIIAILDLLF
jgi:hypothetical protein